MSNTNTELGIDKNLAPQTTTDALTSQTEFYTASFQPAFAPIDNFIGNRYLYGSLSPQSITMAGRYLTSETFDQITIVIPRTLENGSHPIGKLEEGKVWANVMTSGMIYNSIDGNLMLTQDKEKESVDATFHFRILYTGDIYTVSGKLSLLATDPL
jgi:hypothetical protein